jgi:hypothetical protein
MKRNINHILKDGDPEEVHAALEKAKQLAKVGDVISLFDFLCPEDTFISRTADGRKLKR